MSIDADKTTLIVSVNKQIEYAKVNGRLDLRRLMLYNIIDKYEEFVQNNIELARHYKTLKNLKNKLKYRFPDEICNIKTVLPTVTITDEGSIPAPVYTAPVVTDFTVETSKEATLVPSSTLYDIYRFNATTLTSNYSDDNDGLFYQLLIDLTTLDGGALKLEGSNSAEYTLYPDQSGPSVWLPVLREDVDKLVFYSDSNTVDTHPISFKLVDQVDTTFLHSNVGTLTIDRTNVETVNAPASIGDSAILVQNQVTTILTLAMFTTGLTPPYNDPEGDLIDAIRIDEISTANQGVFNFNGSPVQVNDIITRENLEAELFTHVGASVNTIETDAIRFSARDEGSGIWIS